VADGKRVLELLATVEPGSAVASYAAELSSDVGAALEAADAAVGAAQALRVRLNEQQHETREAALALQHELVAYRRVLSRVVGRTHPDYRALRARGRSNAEATSEETVSQSVASDAVATQVAAPTNGVRLSTA
jgi:hypothetical protein